MEAGVSFPTGRTMPEPPTHAVVRTAAADLRAGAEVIEELAGGR
jgi:hypothetical protein